MYDDIKQQFNDLERRLADPKITSDPEKMAEAGRKHAELRDAVNMIRELEKLDENIRQNKEMAEKEEDEELKQMAAEELARLKPERGKLNKKLEAELNPADPNDKKDVIMEIRAGTGGDESALFSADLFRMYSRYAENMGWKINLLHSNRTGIGGFKEVIFEVKGKNVFGHLKFERGAHRVQRVPETEKQGRIHTSASTVAVLPEAEEVDLEIKNEDLRIDTYAASGPGGQKVNTTNSAVRIIHTPTGVTVQCQDQKDQHQNRVKAMQILRSRLLEKIERDRQAAEAAERKEQVGTGDRSEKIRTYNYPQDRITDHRIKKSWSNMDTILGGGLDKVIDELKAQSTER